MAVNDMISYHMIHALYLMCIPFRDVRWLFYFFQSLLINDVYASFCFLENVLKQKNHCASCYWNTMAIQLLTSTAVLIAVASFKWEHFSHSMLMSTLHFMASSLSASGQQHAGREITIAGINSLLITPHCTGPYFTQRDLLANLISDSLMLLNIMQLWWTGNPASSRIIFYWCFIAQLHHFKVYDMAINIVKSSILNGIRELKAIWYEGQRVSALILILQYLSYSKALGLSYTVCYAESCYFLQWFYIYWLSYVIFHNIIIACGCMGVCKCVCIWGLGWWVSIKCWQVNSASMAPDAQIAFQSQKLFNWIILSVKEKAMSNLETFFLVQRGCSLVRCVQLIPSPLS